jgi:hypothetical protein
MPHEFFDHTGKWAPLQLIAIVALPHDARLLRVEDDTSKRLK